MNIGYKVGELIYDANIIAFALFQKQKTFYFIAFAFY